MPFCKECGSALEDDAKYCTVCGTRRTDNVASLHFPSDKVGLKEEQSKDVTSSVSSESERGPSCWSANNTTLSYDFGSADKSDSPKKKNEARIAFIFIILTALVVISAIVYIIASVGGNASSNDSVLGFYSAQKAETNGKSINAKSLWEKGFTIELKGNGKAVIIVDGNPSSAKWTLKGDQFKIIGSSFDCNGILSNEILILENVLDTGVTLYFVKSDAEQPSMPKQSPMPTPSPTLTPTPMPKPVAITNGKVLRSISYKGQCPFKVSAPGGSGGYFVFLKYLRAPSNSKEQRVVKSSFSPPYKSDVVFYVAAGQSVEIDVPVGVYQFFYACGETWYGEKLKFGEETRFYASDDVLVFYSDGDYYQGHSITLWKQENGNFDTDEISESSFPD